MNLSTPHVTIIILNWNHKDDTLECLDSVARMSYPSYSIVLIDNGSTDGSINAIKHWSKDNQPVKLIRNVENIGLVKGRNQGIRHALSEDTDYVFLLDNDVVVEPDVLNELVATAEREGNIGMAGPKIYQYGKDRVLDSAGTRTIPWLAQGFLRGHGKRDWGQYNTPEEMPYITGTALLVKPALIHSIGLMDEDYFIYFDEYDWAYRARRVGYRLLYVPESFVYHKGSFSMVFGSPFYMHHSDAKQDPVRPKTRFVLSFSVRVYALPYPVPFSPAGCISCSSIESGPIYALFIVV